MFRGFLLCINNLVFLEILQRESIHDSPLLIGIQNFPDTGHIITDNPFNNALNHPKMVLGADVKITIFAGETIEIIKNIHV